MRFDRRPAVWALLGTSISVPILLWLLSLADATAAWRAASCMPDHCFCEAVRAAGIRQPVTAYVAANPDLRLVEERFMAIRQAVATGKDRKPETVQFLRELVEELKANGFVTESLSGKG